MAEFERRVTEQTNTGVTDDGSSVREQVSRIETKGDSKKTIVNLIWYLFGLISILLSIRFILKLFGANSANGFVDFVYSVTGVLSAPFDSIFGVTASTTGETASVFEPSILVAIAVYALIAWGVTKLVRINE